MKVGILGSGMVGRVLGAGFIKHGHQVTLGTRDSDKQDLQQWIRETPGAKLGRFEEAAKFGELIVLATLGRVVDSVIKQAGAINFAGKTVIDSTNPLADAPPVNGVLPYFTGPNESLGERVQALLPNADVVKAFNSVGNARMVNPQYTEGVPTMFLCGNSERAKAQVSEVVRQFGWEPFDCGRITSARAIEPLCMLWCIPGLLNNQWGHAFKLLQK